MTTSDQIQLFLAIVTAFTAIASIVLVVLTIRQNSKMIENATRPNISIFGKSFRSHGVRYCLIIKNFGTSNAIITSFECNADLQKYALVPQQKPFSHIENTSIPPGQSLICELNHLKLFNDNTLLSDSGSSILKFKIVYLSEAKKQYANYFIVNLSSEQESVLSRVSYHSNDQNSDKKLLHTIASSLQEITERLI